MRINGKRIFVKAASYKDNDAFVLLENEVRTLKILEKTLINENCAIIPSVVAWNPRYRALFQSFVSGTTLRDLAMADDIDRWFPLFRNALQKLDVLKKLLKGFRHNDFKGDNILEVSVGNALIIDFECATTPCGLIRCPLIDQEDPICEAYGITSNACDEYDLHTIIVDTLCVGGPKVKQKMTEYIDEFNIDKAMFQEVTKKGRLSLSYQECIEKEKHVVISES